MDHLTENEKKSYLNRFNDKNFTKCLHCKRDANVKFSTCCSICKNGSHTKACDLYYDVTKLGNPV